MRRFELALPISLVLAGIAGLLLGLRARSARDPQSIECGGRTYHITRHRVGETLTFDLIDRGRIAASMDGSLDTMCDDPYLLRLDVDGDGSLDLYHHHCGGHGYTACRAGALEYVNLGSVEADDAPAVNGFWGSEVQRGGWFLLVAGGAAACLGLVATRTSWRGRSRDRSASVKVGST